MRYSTWFQRELPGVSPQQYYTIQRIETQRAHALQKTIGMVQCVQERILTGQKRFPAADVWEPQYRIFFEALSKYLRLSWLATKEKTLNYDYLNNQIDKRWYDRLQQIAGLLARNLGYRVMPFGFLIFNDMKPRDEAAGEQNVGIIFGPDWFDQPPDYQLLTLTHEYFHMIPGKLIDHYSRFDEGQVCSFDEAMQEANCLSGFAIWVYTGKDVQHEFGKIPCWRPFVTLR